MGENDEISRLATSIERMAISMEKHIEDSEHKWDEHMKDHRGLDAHVATVNHQLETGRKAMEAIRSDHHEAIAAVRAELPKNPPLRAMLGFAVTVFTAIIAATWNLSDKIAAKVDKTEVVEIQKQLVDTAKQQDAMSRQLDRMLILQQQSVEQIRDIKQQQQQQSTPIHGGR